VKRPKDADEKAVLRERHGLTQREAEVLLWLAGGKSNRDIGEILSLSSRTIDKYLEQIYSKLGVENRTSAAAIALATLNEAGA
jgi:DNA-binding CsgD family transcriptional regulator